MEQTPEEVADQRVSVLFAQAKRGIHLQAQGCNVHGLPLRIRSFTPVDGREVGISNSNRTAPHLDYPSQQSKRIVECLKIQLTAAIS